MNSKKVSIILAVLLVLSLIFGIYQTYSLSKTSNEKNACERKNAELEREIADTNGRNDQLLGEQERLQKQLEQVSEEHAKLLEIEVQESGIIHSAADSINQLDEVFATIRQTLVPDGEQDEQKDAVKEETTSDGDEQLDLSERMTYILDEAKSMLDMCTLLSKKYEESQKLAIQQQETIEKNELTIESQSAEITANKEQLEKMIQSDAQKEQAIAAKDEMISNLQTTIDELEGQLTMMRTTVSEWLVPSEQSVSDE